MAFALISDSHARAESLFDPAAVFGSANRVGALAFKHAPHIDSTL
jgi:hypothetical protein